MKKNSFFLCCCIFLTIGCVKKIIEPFLRLERETISFSERGGVAQIKVDANVPWKAYFSTGNVSWCTLENREGLIEITALENTERNQRRVTVTVMAESLTQKLEVIQLGSEPTIELAPQKINVRSKDTIIEVKVMSNVDYEVILPIGVSWVLPIEEKNVQSTTVEKNISFRVLQNSKSQVRRTQVTFRTVQSDLKVERLLPIEQEGQHIIGSREGFIPILRATSSEAEVGNEIEKSFDGDRTTIYHSPWSRGSTTKFPVILEYFFKDPVTIDYFVCIPRGDGAISGFIGKFDLFAISSSGAEQKVGSYDFEELGKTETVEFGASLKDVLSMRFEIKNGSYDYIAFSQIEFYYRLQLSVEVEEIFTDPLCSTLKPNVTKAQIERIQDADLLVTALALFEERYDNAYRVQEYVAYRPGQDLAKELKIFAPYSLFENPTGIYFDDSEEQIITVIVGETKGTTPVLRICDFDAMRKGEITEDAGRTYPLLTGLNKIKIKAKGLAYIDYFSTNWKTLPPVKIHILSGKVNKYFDKRKHTAGDWNGIINQAGYGCIDIKGDHVHLVYGVESLKQNCNDALALIKVYDTIVALQHELMGLNKYPARRNFNNHMFAKVVKNGLYASYMGVSLAEDCMHEVANPSKAIREGLWAIAHEFGHVNQVAPGLQWSGTTEVTNNIYSVWTRYLYYRENMNLEQEKISDADEDYNAGKGNVVHGGKFNAYLNYGILKGESWRFQRGPDNMGGRYETESADYFVSLCPLWQLMLYYRGIVGGEKGEWFADLAERERKIVKNTLLAGELQLNFIKNICEVLQEDLTDFFEKCGMLKPVDRQGYDDEKYSIKITQSQCDALKNELKRYSKPEGVLYYLSANSEKAYKNKLPVKKIGSGDDGLKWSADKKSVTIEHSVWQNAAVFETYKGVELVKVALVGTDYANSMMGDGTVGNTLVRYPDGATRIEAVAWNGVKTLVYGTR